ncbi:sugar ABC transporter substrate-binding protein [Ruegeria sp. EL01]|jgi:ABC-type glycerol-3-phosphate transport system substrate-binding protein|uniref:ABC transporter substrate-binding protein n=1 Tax=Ruegeria sp. EL01 TaxID=2107578 RepID=UPI000EA82DA0|nr:sugar ABC transporter substrate-binding protein [Ruegeria sp. EL01]
MRRQTLLKAGVVVTAMSLTPLNAAAEDIPYNLKEGQPYAGAKLNILSVVTPQFDGLMLRDDEFTELTGIETEWTFIPFGSLQEKINAEGIAANGTFDVVNYLDSWGPPNAHWLMPIDDMMAQDGISMDRYPAAFARSAQYDGKTLGFPLRAHPQLMFYRKDLIPEPPTSWEEVIEIGKELKESNPDIAPLALYYNNDGNRQNLFIWINFLWAAGADIFNDDWTAAWTSDEAIKATEDYIALHTVHGVTNPNSLAFVEQDARQSFMQGKSAMIPVWWWAYSGFYNPESSTLTKDQVGFTGMPSYDGRTKTYAISMPFSISDYSENKEAAWEFMKWLSNPEMDKANAIEREVAGKSIVNNVVTHISSLQDADVNAANDGIQAAAWESLEESDIMPQIPEWPEVGDILSAAIAKAAAGGDVRELMTEAAEQSNRVLKRAGRIE